MTPTETAAAPTPTATVMPELPPEVIPDYDTIVTEDNTPVDNMYVEKLLRLLTEPLYSSWPGPGEGRPFFALANVGLFHTLNQPPFVPDMMLAIDVAPPRDPHAKKSRSYFVWEIGKTPDVVVEVVSDRRGGEADEKLVAYARLGIPYYVIYDPHDHLGGGVLRAFELRRRRYIDTDVRLFEEVGVGLTLWDGEYEGVSDTWLRWIDRTGAVVATGHELATAERERADAEEQRADAEQRRTEAERQRADAERRRAEAAEVRLRKLEERLRNLGQDANGA